MPRAMLQARPYLARRVLSPSWSCLPLRLLRRCRAGARTLIGIDTHNGWRFLCCG